MKRLQIFFAAALFVLALPPVACAQDSIPNAGFELWTDGNPDGWLTTNSPPDIVNVTQSADAHSGSSAVRGDVVDFMGFAIAPTLLSATAGEAGIPISERWASVRGFYKINPQMGDRFFVNVVFSKASTPIAGGGFVDSNVVLSYTEFVVNMTYLTGDVPDTAFISIQMLGPNGPDYHLGSIYIVDDLSLSDIATGVGERAEQRPVDFGLSNYPNPFNAQTTISYFLPQSSPVRLEVFNLLGQPVRILADEAQAAGSHSVTWDGTDDQGQMLASGIYFYRLQSKGYSEVNRMLLLK